MKKFILTFALILSITLGAIGSAFLPILLGNHKATALALDGGAAEYLVGDGTRQTNQNPTVFMINPTAIASTTSDTYIYDKGDNCIKLITSDIASRKSYPLPSSITNVSDMCAYGDDIYLLTQNNDDPLYKIKVNKLQNTITTTPIALKNSDDVTTYNVTNRNKISCGFVNGSPVLTIFGQTYDKAEQNTYPIYAMQIDGAFNFAYLKLEGEGIVNPGNGPINDIVIVGTSSNAWAIISSSNKAVDSVALKLSNGGQLSGGQVGETYNSSILGTDLPLADIQHLEIVASPNPTLFVAGSQGFASFNLDISSSYITSTPNTSKLYTFTDTPKDFSLLAGKPNILVDNGYYTLTDNGQFISVVNPKCIITPKNLDEFNYWQIETSSNLISEPGSNADPTPLEVGSFVVEIADITLQDNGNPISGYIYVMAYLLGEDGKYTNQYGYIQITPTFSNVIELAKDSLNYVTKVGDGTYLYTLPSDILDDSASAANIANTKTNINGKLPVQVLQKVTLYSTPTINPEKESTQYLLVKVGGKIGFIDGSLCIDKDQVKDLIMPNAKLTHNATIYVSANSNSEVIHNLAQGKKVRIIGSRDKNGYIMVRYNDDYGNEFEGYMLASRVQSYSYTVLQIIGSVLVFLNVLFLIVLVTTKRKIAR